MSGDTCTPGKQRRGLFVLSLCAAILCLQVLMSSQVNAETTQVTALQQLAKTLTAPERVRADFTQKRHLKAFNQPLITQGHMLLLPQRALIWQQQSPVPQILVLTSAQGWTIDQGEASALSAQAQASIAPLLLAALSGDWPSLQTQFTLDYQSAQNVTAPWQLWLDPKPETPLHAVFEQIKLQGHHTIEQITLRGREGDLTELTLTPQAATPLTAQERDWLTPPASLSDAPVVENPPQP
ncbi:hypothetical protein BFW38_13925 [Terasakiispira papahanaumokuakeensis]|uniref:Outer-membrane lipoprotein carrier protein n=1 Tax=Terasakiispira papahanaumokuakeensis TaxID=197479 RepID=A0A1E2VBT9_9GAMM|nr:outer membrane lipoprotein carrier protein LolA [Terasakiispira papahanaumokuakeensis]ODC04467.1 hypothetical protein BFW38_13925 [Terasakiispira papahanaumokuakeensis]